MLISWCRNIQIWYQVYGSFVKNSVKYISHLKGIHLCFWPFLFCTKHNCWCICGCPYSCPSSNIDVWKDDRFCWLHCSPSLSWASMSTVKVLGPGDDYCQTSLVWNPPHACTWDLKCVWMCLPHVRVLCHWVISWKYICRWDGIHPLHEPYKYPFDLLWELEGTFALSLVDVGIVS